MNSIDALLHPGADAVDALNGLLSSRWQLTATATTAQIRAAVGWDDADAVFQLASLLINHSDRRLVTEGKALMEELRMVLDETTMKQTIVDACFFVAVANVKLDEPSKALAKVTEMLQYSPGHPQGIALKQKIENDLMLLAIKGTAGLALGLIGAGIFLKFVRK